jgi:lipopolysaccharide/colanic/teichoic acid biosynthesis glycosyltransferase
MDVMRQVKNTLRAAWLSSLDGNSATALVRLNRVSDIMQYGLAALGLVLMVPLFVVVGLLVKVTSQGPMLYRGLWVGKDGRVFTTYKFRTLQIGAEEKIGARLLTDHDAYYTCIGKFLKRTNLDELPQLINVLKGERNFPPARFPLSVRQPLARPCRTHLNPFASGNS